MCDVNVATWVQVEGFFLSMIPGMSTAREQGALLMIRVRECPHRGLGCRLMVAGAGGLPWPCPCEEPAFSDVGVA